MGSGVRTRLLVRRWSWGIRGRGWYRSWHRDGGGFLAGPGLAGRGGELGGVWSLGGWCWGLGNALGTGGSEMANFPAAGTCTSSPSELELGLIVVLRGRGPRWCRLLLQLLNSRIGLLNLFGQNLAGFQEVLTGETEVGNGDRQSGGAIPLDESEKLCYCPVHGRWCDRWSTDVTQPSVMGGVRASAPGVTAGTRGCWVQGSA